MPHVGNVLATADEDVAVVDGHDPIVLLSCPAVRDFRDAEDITRVVNCLHARTSHILGVIEEVELAGYDNGCLIILQEKQSAFFDSLESDFAEKPAQLVLLKSVEEAELLEQVEDLGHLVESPALTRLEIIPESDVVQGCVLFEQTNCLELVEQVDFPSDARRVHHLVSQADVCINLRDHIQVVPNRFIVLHDHLVTLECLV